MLAREITGRVAALKWAYFNAAAVDGYTVTRAAPPAPANGPRPAGDWTVRGALVPGQVDAFKLAQRPLFFVAPFKGGAWRWEVRTLEMRPDGRFSATLGPMTVESNGITRPTART